MQILVRRYTWCRIPNATLHKHLHSSPRNSQPKTRGGRREGFKRATGLDRRAASNPLSFGPSSSGCSAQLDILYPSRSWAKEDRRHGRSLRWIGPPMNTFAPEPVRICNAQSLEPCAALPAIRWTAARPGILTWTDLIDAIMGFVAKHTEQGRKVGRNKTSHLKP